MSPPPGTQFPVLVTANAFILPSFTYWKQGRMVHPSNCNAQETERRVGVQCQHWLHETLPQITKARHAPPHTKVTELSTSLRCVIEVSIQSDLNCCLLFPSEWHECIWNLLFKCPPCGVFSSGIIYTHLTFLENNPVREVFKCKCSVLSWAVSWLLKLPAYVLVPTSSLFIHLHTIYTHPPLLIMLTSSLSFVFPLRQLWNVLHAVFSASLISTFLCIFLLLLCCALLYAVRTPWLTRLIHVLSSLPVNT